MATYTLTTDGFANFIVIKNNQGISEQRQIISFNTLYKGNAEKIETKDELIKSQQKVNYLDCIKDGKDAMGIPACQALFQGLELFPKAGEGGYPEFSKLAKMEKNLTNLQKDRMDIKQVAKLKKMDDFLPGLDYAEALWESGLSVERVCKTKKNDEGILENPKIIKTFGSFIDPLEKEGYSEKPPHTNWPNIGDTIVIDANAMEAMGFGPSTLTAKRTSEERVDNPYEFKLEIKCGTGMNVAGADNTITQETENYKNYFAGNAEKGKLLKSDGGASGKIKTIILKEWGDKMQVVIYFMKYYMNKSQSITMCAADKVVFMFCLMLNLPCVYTGYLDNEDRLPELRGKKIYSTVEYSPPKTALQMAQQKYDRTKEGILNNNNKLIEFMKMQLDDGTKKKIYIKGVGEANDIPDGFYTKLIEEVEKMNNQVKEVIGRENVEELNKATEDIKKNNMVIVFFKLQGTKKNKKIYLLATQTKLTITKKLSTLVEGSNNFYNLLKSLKPAGTSSRRNVKMKGGAPGDITEEEEEKEYEEMLGELPILNSDGSVDKDTYPNDPSAKYVITKDVEIDLQEELIKGVYGNYRDERKADTVYNYMLYDGILNNGNLMPGLNIEERMISAIDRENRGEGAGESKESEDVEMADSRAFAEANSGVENEINKANKKMQHENEVFKIYLDQLEKEVIGGENYYRFTKIVQTTKKKKLGNDSSRQAPITLAPLTLSPLTHGQSIEEKDIDMDGEGAAAAPVKKRKRDDDDDASTLADEDTYQLVEGGKKRKRKTRKAKKKKRRKTRRKRKNNTKKKKKTRRKIKKRNRKTKRKGIKKKIEKKKR